MNNSHSWDYLVWNLELGLLTAWDYILLIVWREKPKEINKGRNTVEEWTWIYPQTWQSMLHIIFGDLMVNNHPHSGEKINNFSFWRKEQERIMAFFKMKKKKEKVANFTEIHYYQKCMSQTLVIWRRMEDAAWLKIFFKKKNWPVGVL